MRTEALNARNVRKNTIGGVTAHERATIYGVLWGYAIPHSQSRSDAEAGTLPDASAHRNTATPISPLYGVETRALTQAVQRPRTRLRILTTTYTGATEMEALDYFARLPGCQIKVSLDGLRTRLHAKAWIFHRQTGFGSAYVGSANLSGAALLGGLEWTVKFTEEGQPGLFSRAQAHFEALWNDGEFQHYDASKPERRSKLSTSLHFPH